MRLSALVCVALCMPAALGAGPLVMPSGQAAQPLDEIFDESMDLIRWRYLVSALSEPASLYAADLERVFVDLQWLCDTRYAASTEASYWPGAIVTMMDRPVTFGEMDAQSVQVFEAFLFGIDGCEPEDDYYD